MIIPFIKKRHAIQQESHKLIAMVRLGLPVGSEHRIRARRLTTKSATTVRQVVGSAAAFAREFNAGMLSRSYLANRVRWGLMDLGYSDDFVDSITASIVIAMENASDE